MKQISLTLRDEDAVKVVREFQDRVSEQSRQLEKNRTAELSQQFEEKYSDSNVTVSDAIGLLLADELDIEYDI